MKRSFFDRLSGNVVSGDQLDSFDDELLPEAPSAERPSIPIARASASTAAERAPGAGEGQLPVDVYQTGSDIVIRAFVAGVRADELGISLGRDMVEIEGSRMERDQVAGPDYFTRELFWGSFSRTILLPQEVDVESASASSKDGLLTIILPKLDKARQTKLKVKSG